MGGQLGITHRVLDIAVAQIGLQSPSINGPCWLERTHRQARSTMRAKPAVVKYIARLAAEASLPRNAIAYARQIREFADRRKMLAMIETISAGIQSNQPAADVAGVAIETLDEIAISASAGSTPQVSLGEAANKSLERMQWGTEPRQVSWH